MLRSLFGAGATLAPVSSQAAPTVTGAATTQVAMGQPPPITINATINNHADAEHLFRRIQRLQERRGRGGDLRV